MRVYARQAKNPQLEADAWEIRKRAEDKLGELSAALDKAEAHGGRVWLPRDGKSKSEVLREAGISTSAANRYEQFSRLPDGEKEARIAKGRAAIEAVTPTAVSEISARFNLARSPSAPQSAPRGCSARGFLLKAF